MQSVNAESGFDSIALQIRSGERQPVSVEELDAMAERLARLHTEGMALFGAAHIANLSLKLQSHRR